MKSISFKNNDPVVGLSSTVFGMFALLRDYHDFRDSLGSFTQLDVADLNDKFLQVRASVLVVELVAPSLHCGSLPGASLWTRASSRNAMRMRSSPRLASRSAAPEHARAPIHVGAMASFLSVTGPFPRRLMQALQTSRRGHKRKGRWKAYSGLVHETRR